MLTLGDFNRALGYLKLAEKKMHKTFGGLGKAKNSDSTDHIMNYIKMMHATTRKVVLAKFYRDVDGQTLKGIEETLEQMKMIKVSLLPKDGDKLYTYIGKDNDNESNI